jgi:hypothetical protein
MGPTAAFTTVMSFQDLAKVPGDSAVVMNDTQKIGYLLSGIRPEKTLQSVYVNIQQDQIRGGITFEDACADLHHRCKAIRADELLSGSVRNSGPKRALISTKAKRINLPVQDVDKSLCLAKGCLKMVKIYLPCVPCTITNVCQVKIRQLIFAMGLVQPNLMRKPIR